MTCQTGFVDLVLRPVTALVGKIRPPSDKSITHRVALMSCLSDAASRVSMPLKSDDTYASFSAARALGVDCHESDGDWIFEGAPKLRSPNEPIDCGNSGTTMRLLCGILAGAAGVEASLIGDGSLSKRPMARVCNPLREMGAEIEGNHAPLLVRGRELRANRYEMPVASAQVKSAILLAGLQTSGETWVREPSPTRDHTERILESMGIEVFREPGGWVGIRGPQRLLGINGVIPADISSAAFWLVAASIVPGSKIELLQVGTNSSRTGIFDVLDQCGQKFNLVEAQAEIEPFSDISIRHQGGLTAFTIEGEMVPRLVDEIPVLALLATQCDGVSTIRGAGELRVKESDRIQATTKMLSSMGANIEPTSDGFVIQGPTPLKGTTIESNLDHRIAMTAAIASCIAAGETIVKGSEAIRTSYPDFDRNLGELSVR